MRNNSDSPDRGARRPINGYPRRCTMIAERLLTASLALTLAASTSAQVHIHVDDDAPNGGNGLSWESALNDLNDAIILAKAFGQNRGEIRIAGGIYKADRGTGDPGRALNIPPVYAGEPLLALRGGYAGLELPGNPNHRDPDAFPTLLDADLIGNDSSNPGSRTDNSQHLIIIDESESISGRSVVSGIVLDGIAFRGAAAAAIECTASGATLSLVGCRFFDNQGGHGSALRARRSDVSIQACTFEHNESAPATGTEAGALNFVSCEAIIENSAFLQNTALGNGGAIAATDTFLEIRSSEFTHNSATGLDGGALYIKHDTASLSTSLVANRFESNSAAAGGAVHSQQLLESSACTYAFNYADSGGALWGRIESFGDTLVGNSAKLDGGGAFALAGSTFQSSTIQFNSAQRNGGGVYADSFNTSITNSTITGNRASSNSTLTGSGGGVYGVGTIDGTTIDGNIADEFGGGVFSVDRISDSTIDGNLSGDDGGGVHGANTVERCTITRNRANGGFGGGTFEATEVTDSMLTGNRSVRGGGLYNSSRIRGTLIATNTATGFGGGVYVTGRDVEIVDSAILNNNVGTAFSFTEVMKAGEGRIDLIRCTIANNNGLGKQLARFVGDSAWIESCIIWDTNWAGSHVFSIATDAAAVAVYSNLRTSPEAVQVIGNTKLILLAGNVNANPRFVDIESNNAALLPGSHCIDAGYFWKAPLNLTDPFGNPRSPLDDVGVPNTGIGLGGFLDIGATEFAGTSCLPDVNNDGLLTAADFSAWIAAFNAGDSAADQNRDALIDQNDFSAWIANYNNGCP